MKSNKKLSQTLRLNTALTKKYLTLFLLLGTLVLGTGAIAQSVIAPPALGQETKGTPAVAEVSAAGSAMPDKDTADASNNNLEQASKAKGIDSLLGNATITESKRESGQRYLIELEHSAGTKQYIEETDSDGKIESTSNDIEETPNLAKWKIGSW